ncbi:hypothetical protein PR048_000381 [Dryococelus australis]|uniref:Uncharacterized protein n=1 Tax=Dryococelus australis TaxID=614101 RepID=A0ABQ9IFC1_9NEOP|nr:hypothetical protein PR048_000381 [Dryococelus australis]
MHKNGSSEETKRELTQYIRPNEKNIEINKIIKTNSHAIIIEMPNEEQAEKLEEEIRNKEVKMKFDRLQKRNPKTMVYGVRAELGKEEFLENICNQNLSEDFDLDEHKKETKICFETKEVNRKKNIVIKTSPKIYKRIMNKKKIYCGW